ncbi:MAG: HAMP domain-containing sensor histidine kinase [Pseudomonadota bacterium]
MNTLIQESDSLKLVEKLIRRIVHDLSNPLSAVVGFAELLSYPSVSEEKRRRYVHLILEQATRARQIIDTMSQFGDLPDPQIEDVDLNPAVRTAVSLRQAIQRTANIEITLDLVGCDVLMVRADRQYIGRILMNLLLNAEQAFKEQGASERRLLIRTLVVDDTAQVLVADSGKGVADEIRDRVFEPFFSGRKSGGLGLGLHVSRSVAQRMGCDLVLLDAPVSPEWPGAGFLFTLPTIS